MNTSSSVQHSQVNNMHPLHTIHRDSCCWSIGDLALLDTLEAKVTIKTEPPDVALDFVDGNVQMEEVVDNFYIKQECQDTEVNELTIGKDIQNFTRDCEGCGVVSKFQDGTFIVGVVTQEVIIEPRLNLNRDTSNYIKEECEDQFGSQPSGSVIEEDVTVKTEDSFDVLGPIKLELQPQSFENEEALVKNEIVVKEDNEFLEKITKLNVCLEENQYCTPYSNEKPKLHLQSTSKITSKLSEPQHTGKKPSRCKEFEHSYEFISQHLDEKVSNSHELAATDEESAQFNLQHIREKPSNLFKLQHSGEKSLKCNLEVAKQNKEGCKTPKSLKDSNDNTKVPYNRGLCNVKGSKEGEIYEHLKKRIKKILHKCSKCEYSSLDKRLFHQHLTTHTKAYKCTKCKYRASRKQYLDSHMKTHIDSPYKCHECEYRATQRSTVTRHFNAVHLNV